MGFFATEQGHVLTSLMAVAGCSAVDVVGPDGRTERARVFAMDQSAGLALLETGFKGVSPLPLADHAPRGRVHAVSRSNMCEASGHEMTLQSGSVSAERRSARVQGYRWTGLVCAAVNVQPGHGVGPLLDDEGRVGGVILGIRPAGGPSSGHDCYVIPAPRLKPILEELLAGRSRRLGWLGLAVSREEGKTEGVRVAGVLENSPAHEAGVRPGDVLLQIGETVVDSSEVLAEMVAEPGPRKGVELKLLSRGKVRSVSVDIRPRPLLIVGSWGPGRHRVGLMRPAGAEGAPADPRRLLNRILQENAALRRRMRELQKRLGEHEEQ